jgi:glycerophosphoryl diester phosphodiesterase
MEPSRRSPFLAHSFPLIIAHRGDSKVAPENTLPAFASAIEAGADCIELDTHASANGTPVVIHDKTLDRTTNAKALWGGEQITVLSKTVEQLAPLDAGTWFDPKFASAKVPTLEAAIDLILPRCLLMVERKSGNVDDMLKVLRAKKAIDRVTLQAFDWEFIAESHRKEPRLVLGALGDKDFDPEKVTEAASIGASIVNWNAKYLTPEAIATIHESGLQAWTWTVDDRDLATRLIAAKIDAITTNVPHQMRQWILPPR